MRYTSYTIRQGDTMEVIATNMLGSPDRAAQLIALNNLRWPYISDDPRDQLGTPRGSYHLTENSQGGRTLQVDGYDPLVLAAGNWVLLRGYGGNIGTAFYDTAVIFGSGTLTPQGMQWSREMLAEFTPQQLLAFPRGNVIYLTGGPNHAYVAGSELLIYGDPNETLTHVLSVGQTLLLPLDANSPNVFSAVDGNAVSMMGCDIAVDTNGMLLLAQKNDVATVEGNANIAQAIRIRLTTYLRELVMHPDYGNALLDSIGETNDTLIPVAYAATIGALLADPRILRLTNMNITQRSDTIICNFTVQLRDKSILNINNLVLAVGID